MQRATIRRATERRTRQERIHVNVDCVAQMHNQRSGFSDSRIIEFIDPVTKQGGLIEFRRHPESGELYVSVYNHDAKVIVKDGTRSGN